MPESPRARDGDPPSQAKKQSLASRLLGSLGQGRKDAAGSGLNRASSTASQSPIPRMREWLDSCNSEHGSHCSGTDPLPTWRPVFLVDAVDGCLVRAKPSDRYTALSYVWGIPPQRYAPGSVAELLASNVDAFLQQLPDTAVPRTFLDAIWLSRKLGIRHIWIDRLCVVQDDADAKIDHAQHMAYVFANAYLTIVAAHGDVATGLLPLDPRRPVRNPRAGTNEHDELLLASKWSARAWTLQELLYSRRAIFFFEDTITWECHCDGWQGPAAAAGAKAPRGKRGACANSTSTALLGYRHAPWPDLDEFARIAIDYSTRKVTFVDDSLPAFEGISRLLSNVFAGGVVYGMPLVFLDAALLWKPQATIRRRALSRPPFLPSWSWMGWWFDGVPVDLTLWRAAADFVEETVATRRASKRFQPTHSFRLKPTVTWHLTDRANTVAVDNAGFRYRELRSRKNLDAPLPPGWSRTGSGSRFSHDSDESTVFKYPVPVLDPLGSGGFAPGQPPRPLPGPLLAFRTAFAFFDVDYAISLNPKDKANPPVAVGNIWSRKDKWIGEFRAHDGWLGVQSSNYGGDEKLEFIAISTASERRGSYVFSLEKFEENMNSDEKIDIVNVMWIERISGIAYRRGIGHILHKAWDAEATDEVDILLG
ncbi:tol protein [Drechmeria coniospora]|uniref:Tol protein n=1 Tax=Drechmeria coniospora TaxID=98403 RepID=A0A151GSH5_DRECN|nr:tol protein [Drechmeria coniospora]KYK60021.1 tol protein [Drechmeria coniospora]ODA78821.1 hypothetical protein RJ55_06205 [Drechmeria coniospora]